MGEKPNRQWRNSDTGERMPLWLWTFVGSSLSLSKLSQNFWVIIESSRSPSLSHRGESRPP